MKLNKLPDKKKEFLVYATDNFVYFLLNCLKCRHSWIPKFIKVGKTVASKKPKVCPKCKSESWDKPYKYKLKKHVIFKEDCKIKE